MQNITTEDIGALRKNDLSITVDVSLSMHIDVYKSIEEKASKIFSMKLKFVSFKDLHHRLVQDVEISRAKNMSY